MTPSPMRPYGRMGAFDAPRRDPSVEPDEMLTYDGLPRLALDVRALFDR